MPTNIYATWRGWGDGTQLHLKSDHIWYVGGQWVGLPKGWHAVLFLKGKVMLESPTFTTREEAQIWALEQRQPLPTVELKKRKPKKPKTAWERLVRRPAY